jgi:hypothetical protein|tara:strand:- start:4335 stop:4769 length:435 start_codon:yes stop_codon:yes gene_type:complete
MYALVENGSVTRIGGLPKNWKNVSGLRMADDATLLSLGWYPVVETNVTAGANEVKTPDTVTVVDNTVTKVEQVRTMTDEEIAERLSGQLESLRFERNELLAETDWMAASDRTMTDAQTAYRQALRDLPANTTDPASPAWPTKPE